MRYLLLSLLTLMTGAVLCSAAGRFYVVSVGVSDYPGTELDLHLPVADAKSVATLYKTCENANVLLFTDDKALAKDIVDNATALFSRADEDDVIIFYFSGHGFKGGYVAYDGKLEYEDIRKAFRSSRAGSKILFADACKSGSMRQGQGHSGASTALGSDVMLFLSCRSDEYSIESRSMINGFFTACLVRALKGGADDNRDKVITARELFDAVSGSVAKLSSGKQHPVMWGNFNDTMPVINWNK